MQIGNILQWERTAGEPISVGDLTLTPESQALSLHLPFGGFVWNRPTAVLVVDGNGDQRRIPIVDVTRAAQLTLLAAAALFFILGFARGPGDSRS